MNREINTFSNFYSNPSSTNNIYAVNSIRPQSNYFSTTSYPTKILQNKSIENKPNLNNLLIGLKKDIIEISRSIQNTDNKVEYYIKKNLNNQPANISRNNYIDSTNNNMFKSYNNNINKMNDTKHKKNYSIDFLNKPFNLSYSNTENNNIYNDYRKNAYSPIINKITYQVDLHPKENIIEDKIPITSNIHQYNINISNNLKSNNNNNSFYNENKYNNNNHNFNIPKPNRYISNNYVNTKQFNDILYKDGFEKKVLEIQKKLNYSPSSNQHEKSFNNSNNSNNNIIPELVNKSTKISQENMRLKNENDNYKKKFDKLEKEFKNTKKTLLNEIEKKIIKLII